MAKEKKSKPRVNEKLEGFQINVDNLGEISSTFDIDKINKFLNEEVEDKKLIGREDFEDIKSNDEEEDSE